MQKTYSWRPRRYNFKPLEDDQRAVSTRALGAGRVRGRSAPNRQEKNLVRRKEKRVGLYSESVENQLQSALVLV